MSAVDLQHELTATRQVLADLLREKLQQVYVVQTEGARQEVLAVFVSIESAKSFVELRAGREMEWKYANAHGPVWWPARDASGIITEHEVRCD
jgi:hypothetical protein